MDQKGSRFLKGIRQSENKLTVTYERWPRVTDELY